MIIKTLTIVFVGLFIFKQAKPQDNQQKAQGLVFKYISNKPNLKSNQNINFSKIEVLRSSFVNAKQYKNLVHKIDSLKLLGRKIDARIPKLKTTAEINQAKKDSKHLSDQLVAGSNELIDFMAGYKGAQIGWFIKSNYPGKTEKKKIFYLNRELTKVDSVK